MTKNWLKTNNWGLKQRLYSFGWLIGNEEFFQGRVYCTDQHNQYFTVPVLGLVQKYGCFVPPQILSTRDGNGAGWSRRMGSSSLPRWLLPFPIPAPPQGARQTTLPHPPHPRPLGPHRDPPLIQFYIYK